MPQYIIYIDCGYEDEYEEVSAENEEEANKIAYKRWREEAEVQAGYGVIGEATDDLREEFLS